MEVQKRKTIIETIIILAIVFAAMILACEEGFAVEASPESPYKGRNAKCCSETGKILKIKDIPYKLGEKGKLTTKSLNKAGDETRAIPLVAIVIGFNNISYSDEYDWSASLFNGKRSVAEYYKDMSFGRFTFTPVEEGSAYGSDGNSNTADKANDGIVHVKLDTPHKDWSSVAILNDYEKYQSYRDVQQLALTEAAKYVDFDRYDVDKDTLLDQEEIAVAFIVAGYEGAKWSGEHTYGKEKYLWAHAGGSWAQATPKSQLQHQISISENLAEKRGIIEQAPNNVLVHELGHYLGFPDLYMLPEVITEGTSAAWHWYDVSYLSIMSSTWTEDEDGRYMPYSLDPWCRVKAGWVSPETASEDGEYRIVSQDYTDISKKYGIVRINTEYENEYFLVENRQKTKWDSGLENAYYDDDMKNGGIVIWHIEDLTYADYFPNKNSRAPSIMPLYPETVGDAARDGSSRTFIGDAIVSDEPFFSKEIWQARYKDNVGNSLILPIYAIPSEANAQKRIEEILPGDRVYSNIDIAFLSDNDKEMTIKVSRGSCVHERQVSRTRTGVKDCNAIVEYEADSICTKCGRDLGSWKEMYYPKGHDWVFDSFRWKGNQKKGYKSAEVVYRCKNQAWHTYSGKEPEKIKAKVTKKVIKPTYEKRGYTIYKAFVSAEISSDGKEHTGSKKAVFTPKLAKKPNTLSAKGKTVKISHNKLKRKNRVIKRAKLITVKRAIGKVTYRKAVGRSEENSSKISIDPGTGNITVKKGLKKGIYKVKIKVTAAGSKTCSKATKTVTVRIKVLGRK